MLDVGNTPPITPRSGDRSRLHLLLEKETIEVKPVAVVEKIDVNSKRVPIKKKSRLSLDFTRTTPDLGRSPQLTLRRPAKAVRNDLFAKALGIQFLHNVPQTHPRTHQQLLQGHKATKSTEDPPSISKIKQAAINQFLQDTDPYSLIRSDRPKYHPIPKAPARTSRMTLTRSRASLVSSPITSPRLSVLGDLMTGIKFLQRRPAEPIVKETMFMKTEDIRMPESPVKPTHEVLKSSTVYRIKQGKSNDLYESKTQDSAKGSYGGIRSKSKAEKQWQWKGSYGPLKSSSK
jgi:hypothetical protein